MAIRNQGWAFISSSVGTTSPGGADTNIQFNNNGSFQGTAKLITDGSGSLSASVNISASSFYGDGSNLTGLTASAVNVADGPETAIQFRIDSPVTGEISGSYNLMFLTASNILKVKGDVSASGDGRFKAIDIDSTANVLTKTTLGSTVVNSSLTSVGTLVSLTSSNATISNLTSSNTIEAKGLQIDTNGTIGTAGDTDLLSLGSAQLTVRGVVSGSGLLKGRGIEIDTNGLIGTAGDVNLLTLQNNKLVVAGVVSSSQGITGSHFLTDGIASASHFVGNGAGLSNVNAQTAVTASTANRNYELAFTEYPGTDVELGANTGLFFNPAGNAGANGFSGSLFVSASHAGNQMSRIVLGSAADGQLLYQKDGSDLVLGLKTSTAGIDVSSSNDGGIVLAGGDSAGTIINGNGSFFVQNAAEQTKFSVAGTTGKVTATDISASLNVSASSYYMLANSGSIAGPSSYLGLDASNRIVVTAGDGAGGGAASAINVTASTANRTYELAFTEYPGNGVKLGANTGLSFNTAGSGASGFSGSLSVSASHAGFPMSRVILGSAADGQLLFQKDGSDLVLGLKTSTAGIDLSSSNAGGIVLAGGDSAGTIVKGDGAGLLVHTAAEVTKASISSGGVVSGSGKGQFSSLEIDSTAVITSARAIQNATTISGSGLISGQGLRLDTGGQIGTVADADLLQLGTNQLTVKGTISGSGIVKGRFLEIDTNGLIGTAGDTDLLKLENNKLLVRGVVSSSLGISGSSGKFLGLLSASHHVGNGAGLTNVPSQIAVTASTANRNYELAFTEYPGTDVKLGGSTGLFFNPAGNNGANGFSGSLTISASHAGKPMSRVVLGSDNDAQFYYKDDGGDLVLAIATSNAGIDISASNDGGIVFAGGDSAGTIVKGNGSFFVQNAAEQTKFSVAGTTGKVTATDISSSVHVSASAYYMLPTTGTIAGPSSYLGLDSRNKIVVTAGDGSGGGATINVTASAANRSYELAFTEFPGSGVKLGLNTGLSFNPAGNAGANGFSGSLTISASHAGVQMSRLLLGSKDDGQLFYKKDGSDLILGLSTTNAGIDISSSNGGGIVLAGGDSAGTIVKGNGLFMVQKADETTTFSVTATSGDVSAGNVSGSGDGRFLALDLDSQTNVLTKTTLGSTVVNSSLTSVGTLTTLTSSNANISSSTNAVLFHVDTDSYNAGKPVFLITGSQGVGINNGSPKLALDVHYSGTLSPVSLANDTGGGHVVYFGTSSANLTAGGVYYLNQNGGWESVNSATTGSGHNQLLGIALGQKPASNGVLLKGYFDVNSFYSGSFIKGGPVYIQSSSVLAGRGAVEGGYLSSSAPTTSNSYVRIVGYGTDTANVIYFDPDATYVELA